MSFRADPDQFLTGDAARCALLERQLARERRIRMEAEAIAERGLRQAYLSNRRFQLLCSIANVANETTDPMETLRFAIAEICAVKEWAFANVLVKEGTEGDTRLAACGIWHARNPDQMFSFAERSTKLVVWPCASTPGRLLIDQTTAWTRDIQTVSGFARSEEARRCNLRSSISVPVIQGQELVAAMEFFTHDTIEPDPQLLETLNQIGVQIGRVFKRRASAQMLLADALSDPLTGLPNRKMFEAQLERLFMKRATHDRSRMSLIYIDLDGFKLVNDALGHMAGDQLLIEMACRLQRVATEYVTTPFPGAPDDVVIARMGGDEFTILVEGEHHRQVAVDIAKDIHSCLKPSHFIDTNEVRCAASVGIAHDDGGHAVAADLMRDADVAMYDAKARGHGQTTVFDQSMRDRAVHRLQLEAELRLALERHEFRLHYQPIVDIANGRIAGFEALLRWQRGEELIQPDEFLHVAEQSGMMNVVGTWVLREACSVAASWRRAGNDVQRFYMSVNVAPSQFLQPDFVEQVRDIIHATNVDPCTLVIEVTEGAAITNRQRTAQILDELRAMGIRLSLDDFGTGYSSFSHLQTLPFDSIKIDRSFVSGEQTNMSWNIVDAMLSFARAMDMNVVAEGIETQYQLDRLAEVGCAFGQGFLYDRAITADMALEMLRGANNYVLPTAETLAPVI